MSEPLLTQPYTIYDTATGEIKRTVECPADQLEYLYETGSPAYEDYIDDTYDPDTYYVSGSPPAATAKTLLGSTFDVTSIDADGVDAATITGLPNPTNYVIEDLTETAGINKVTGTITDGTLVVTLNVAATVEVRLTSITKLEYSEEITAT